MINATACILIGGKSKRFGSTKWKAKLGSKSVIEHIWSASSEFKFQYLIGKTKPKNIKKMFIEDLFDSQAPIIGLVSSIKSSKTDWILLLSILSKTLTFATCSCIYHIIIYSKYLITLC